MAGDRAMTRSALREQIFYVLFCADFYPASELPEQLEASLELAEAMWLSKHGSRKEIGAWEAGCKKESDSVDSLEGKALSENADSGDKSGSDGSEQKRKAHGSNVGATEHGHQGKTLNDADTGGVSSISGEVAESENKPSAWEATDRAYIMEKSRRIVERIDEIDQMVNDAAEGWQTNRMAKTDLALIRLAVYEMKFDESVPTGVAINEAVELAKKYGAENSPSFVNGILARLA